MNKDMPADWAIERALEPFREAHSSAHWTPKDIQSTADNSSAGFRAVVCALARYIEAHEQPPVDPDLVTAREICAKVAKELAHRRAAAMYLKTDLDNDPEVQFALAKLKEARGK